MMPVKKTRFSVTLTPYHVRRLNILVKKGIDIDHQSAIREALKRYYEYHGIYLTDEEDDSS